MNDRALEVVLESLAGGNPEPKVGDVVEVAPDYYLSSFSSQVLRGVVIAVPPSREYITVDFAMSGWHKGHSANGLRPGSTSCWYLGRPGPGHYRIIATE